MKPENMRLIQAAGKRARLLAERFPKVADRLLDAAREEGRQSALSALRGRQEGENSSSQGLGHQPCGSRDEAGGAATAALAPKFAVGDPVRYRNDGKLGFIHRVVRGGYNVLWDPEGHGGMLTFSDDELVPLGATASPTPDTGSEEVAAEVRQPIREEQ